MLVLSCPSFGIMYSMVLMLMTFDVFDFSKRLK